MVNFNKVLVGVPGFLTALSITTVAIIGFSPVSAGAAEIRVMSTTAFRSTLESLKPKFEHVSGDKLVIEYGVANLMQTEIEKGASFDVGLLIGEPLDALIKDGKIDRGTRTTIAKMGNAVGIHTGGRRYDISTVEAFKKSLLQAKSIVYSAPGTSGVFFVQQLAKLGLTKALQSKLIAAPSGDAVGVAVATGHAEIGILPASELLPVAGVEVLGPFPEAVQDYAFIVGGVSPTATQPEAGRRLLAFIVDPANRQMLISKGLQPAD